MNLMDYLNIQMNTLYYKLLYVFSHTYFLKEKRTSLLLSPGLCFKQVLLSLSLHVYRFFAKKNMCISFIHNLDFLKYISQLLTIYVFIM